MFESKDAIAEAVDRLLLLSRDYQRGQVIPWEQIEAVTGPRNENWHAINKWRMRLRRERETVTLPCNSVGIRLLTHSEAAQEIPRLRQRRAYRQVRRALRETATVDLSQLSDNDRKNLVHQRAAMAEQRKALSRSMKAAKRAATETAPLRAMRTI